MDRKHATNVNRRGENHLLSLIPPADRRHIEDYAQRVALNVKHVLFQAGRPITEIYFPLSGMVSLVITSAEGKTIEVGTIGNEGVAGASLALGSDRTLSEAVIQVAGEFLRLKSADFLNALRRSNSLQAAVQRFTLALMTQISQSLVCNQVHPVEQRICRWLLMSDDRIGAGELRLTQEFMAQMLGVRRPSVTVVAGMLQKAELIRYSRGLITILDRKGLEDGACECYGIVKAETERLLQG